MLVAREPGTVLTAAPGTGPARRRRWSTGQPARVVFPVGRRQTVSLVMRLGRLCALDIRPKGGTMGGTHPLIKLFSLNILMK